MTISTTQNRIEYNGNDLATSFAFPYPFLEDADIYVVLILASGVEDPQVLNTDYTLTGAGSGSGGTITMVTPPATGQRLVIYREVPLTQETDYVSGDPFPAESHERALDKLTMITQQLTEQVSRTLQFAITTPAGFPNELPAPEASTIIGWNAGASALQNYSLTGLGVSVNYAQWQTDEFSGDGSETEFVLTNDAGVASNISLSVGGVVQSPLSDFTYNATTKTITFNTAPPLATNNIVARYGQALAQTVPDIQDNTVVLEKLEQIPASTILGRDDSGNGNVQALTLGTGLTATGGVLSAAAALTKATSADVITGTDDAKYLTALALRGGAIVQSVTEATTSGSTKDVTGIPSWAKRITIQFNGVSTNGTTTPLIQIGDGSISASGYLGAASTFSTTVATSNHSSGFLLANAVLAATVLHGHLTLQKLQGSNLWTISGALGGSNAAFATVIGGSKSLTNALDRVRLTTNSADAFDAGSWCVSWE